MTKWKQRRLVELYPENYDKIKELLPPRMSITMWVNLCIKDQIELMSLGAVGVSPAHSKDWYSEAKNTIPKKYWKEKF